MDNKEQAKVEVLRFPGNVRLRRGMYLDNPDHCVFEMVDNSTDEYSAGRCKNIGVAIINDEVIVEDDGSGIPVDPSDDPEYKGLSQAEVAYITLHAGGKFGSKDGYQTNTGGLHGVGASAVNATSEYCHLISRCKGKEWEIDFEKGITTKHLYETKNKIPKDQTGTEVHFKLDPEVWGEEWYDFSHLKRRFRQLAFLNPGLTIQYYVDSKDINGKEVKINETFSSADGLIGYINRLTTGKVNLIDPELIEKKSPFTISTHPMTMINGKLSYDYTKKISEERDIDINIAFVYTESYSSELKSFVNNVATENGGDHEIGFKAGLLDAIRKYASENELVKDAKTIESDDCREGMQAILSVKVKDPNFEGQGKSKLRMSQVRSAVKNCINDYIYDYLNRDAKRGKLIIEKVLKAGKAREAAKRARNAERGIKTLNGGARPDNFADCSSSNPEECEIFLVEGDSAGGSAKQGRDRHFQAILPIFGKILNAEKATLDKILNSKKLRDAFRVFGTGVGKDFDLSKLKYFKIILMADADSDGGHIQCLHMTNFYRIMRPLIEAGHVYAACPPLYKVQRGNGKNAEVTYLYTVEELEKFDTTGCSVQRYKGLGEMNPEQLWETTMNPKSRRLIQIVCEDPEETEQAISVCMGENVEVRKDFIFKYYDSIEA